MKELKSTELLDKQIQLEAAKKIQTILEKADRECEEILQTVTQELEEARKQKQEFYNRKLKEEQVNLEATFPLEKQRLELAYIQEALISGINEYLEKMGDQKRLSIVLGELNEQKSVLQDKKCSAYIYGFDFNDAKKELEKAIGSNLLKVEKTEYGKMIIENDLAIKCQQGIILEAQDKSFRIRLTLNQIISRILDENRDQLNAALFGEGEND